MAAALVVYLLGLTKRGSRCFRVSFGLTDSPQYEPATPHSDHPLCLSGGGADLCNRLDGGTGGMGNSRRTTWLSPTSLASPPPTGAQHRRFGIDHPDLSLDLASLFTGHSAAGPYLFGSHPEATAYQLLAKNALMAQASAQ